jgi:hypothetical protein
VVDGFSAYDTALARQANLGGIWIDDGCWVEEDLPRRNWIAPGYALRGAVTVITGPPSAMKSSLMLAWASAIALDAAHGEFRPAQTGAVVVYNVEDDQTEQRRRLSAVLRQFDACPADIQGKVIRTGPSGIGTLVVRQADTGFISATPAMHRLRELLRERKAVMLIADPLAELHTAEENDNTGLRAVIAEFRSLAIELDLSVVLIHHTRKGALAPGDPDNARGASAIIGAARVVLTLCTMSEDDAKGFGLATDRKTRSAYTRLDEAKQNYAAIGDAIWYERVLYRLDNEEHVPAAVPWAPPDLWKSIPAVEANAILDMIDRGVDGGSRRYTNGSGRNVDDRAAWKVVVEHIQSLTPAQARQVVATWLKKGVLGNQTYRDPIERKDRLGLIVLRRPS